MDDNRVPEHDFDRWCRERGVEPGPESFAEYLGSVSFTAAGRPGAVANLMVLPGIPEPPVLPAAKLTEREMLDLLHARFGFISRNGGVPKPRYVKAEHVRAATGFDRRTADFVAVDTWASGKCAIHGVEVKVTRSDWLRELKEPDKSAACMNWCTYWWLAVSDRVIVRDGELPPGWGLLAVRRHGGGVRLERVTDAPFRAVPPIPPQSMAALLYAVAKTAAARGAA